MNPLWGKNGKDPKSKLVTSISPRSPASESFRSLRTSLRFADIDQDVRLILVTSPGPAEGKSTVLANLAVTMAQSGKRVLAVDADLRKPTLHRIFEADQQPGLTNILVGDCPVESGIKSTGLDLLDIIAAGPIPPNPSEILEAQAARDVFGQLREMYDCVLVDTPPVIAVTDAVAVASAVDGVILVMRSGVTRIEAAVEAKSRIENAQGRTIGVILNEVRRSTDGYNSYQYYYGQQHKHGHPTWRRGIEG